jgi:hypothetical protein
VFKTHRTVILGYLICLGLFFYASFIWLQNPISVGGTTLMFTIPIYTVICIGLLIFAARIWKIKLLHKFASGSLAIAVLIFSIFASQVPKYSQQFVEYKLTQYGYRTYEKFPLIFKENQPEFERVISEIRAKIGKQQCNENTVTEKQFITLRQSFLGILLRLHPICDGREISIPVMTPPSFEEVGFWEIKYFIDWQQKAHPENMCGKAICTEIAPGWIEYILDN